MVVAMRMTLDEFKKKATTKFKELIDRNAPPCPLCNSSSWHCPGYSEITTSSWDDSNQGVVISIPLICNKCGCLIHLAASTYE